MGKQRALGVGLAVLVFACIVGGLVHHKGEDVKRDLLLIEYRARLAEYEAGDRMIEKTGTLDIALANIPPSRGVTYRLILRPVYVTRGGAE